MSLHESALAIATMVSRKEPQDLKIILDHRVPYPYVQYLGRPVSDHVIHVPLPEKLVPENLGPLPRDVTQLRVFRACVAHEACHVYLTNPVTYEASDNYGKPLMAVIVNTIEDHRVETFLISKWSGLGRDIVFANAIAFLRFRPLDDTVQRVKRLVLAVIMRTFCGRIKGTVRDEDGRLVDAIYDLLRDVKWSADAKNLVDTADRIYAILASVSDGGTPKIPVLPHQDGKRTWDYTRYIRNGIDAGELPCILKDIAEQHSLSETFVASNNDDQVEAEHVFHREEFLKTQEDKVIQSLKSVPTKFRTIGYPTRDYAEYLRVKLAIAPIIKSIENQLSSVVTEDAEVSSQVSGVMDLNEAMQAVASESNRTDVFLRWRYAERGSAWAVLLDNSRSLSNREGMIREIGTIFAEVLKKLCPPNNWGLYAFSDVMVVLKDFKEKYDRNVASRIGGLTCSGATYLPDALQAVSQRLFPLPQNAKVVVVVSDGQPYGYPGIEEKTITALKRISNNGVIPIGIGLRYGGISEYFRNWCRVDTMKELPKAFVRQYLSLIERD